MSISASQVKELREKTGSGMMDCKKALLECNGDMEQAVDFLRAKGLASAEKKGGRAATEGLVYSYIHGNGKVGVLLEVNCETEPVARTNEFQTLVKDIAMHIAALSPSYVREEEIPQDVLERERAVYLTQTLEEGKPENIAGKIVEGRMNKFYTQVCLLKQNFVKEDKKTVEEVVKEVIAVTGENIQVRRFARFTLGEGLEKRQDDLAAEVAKLTGN